MSVLLAYLLVAAVMGIALSLMINWCLRTDNRDWKPLS